MAYLWSRNGKEQVKERKQIAITRPVKNGKDVETKSDDSDEDIELELQRAKQTIINLEAALKERDCEVRRLLIKLDENTSFLQRTVMELIQLKANTPSVVAPASSRSAVVDAYYAKKNQEEADRLKKEKEAAK